MKTQILTICLVLLMGTGLCRADEIVLENGKIYSGNVLDLTENTVSILVDQKRILINRKEVQAVFLGEENPFSSHGYPGLGTPSHSQPDTDEPEKE